MEENSYRDVPTGIYYVHIFIEETVSLQSVNENQLTVDPIIVVQCFGKTKYSKILKNRGKSKIVWAEHFFLKQNIDDPSEFLTKRFKISIFDHKSLSSDALIGEYEMDLSRIYLTNLRAIKNQWVAITNSEKNFEATYGFLKFSCSVVNGNQKQAELTLEPIHRNFTFSNLDKENNQQLNILQQIEMPPQIKVQMHELQIDLVRAEKLVKMDNIMGSIDSYIYCQIGTINLVTKKIENNFNPFYMNRINIPYSIPSLHDELIMSLYDYDSGSQDELVATFRLNINTLATQINQYYDYYWINLYGSQLNAKNIENAKMMNQQSNIGSFWKGRILVSIKGVPSQEQRKTIEAIDQKALVLQQDQYYKESKNQKDILLKVECYFGSNFPDAKGKYSIQLRWADNEINFDSQKPNYGSCWEWYKRIQTSLKYPYKDESQFPDIFVYLVNSDGLRVSFIRKTYQWIKEKMFDDPITYKFKPDKSMFPDLNEEDAGIIKLKIAAGYAEEFDDYTKGGWGVPLIAPKHESGYMIANIYQAKNLLATDNDGMADPYIIVSHYGGSQNSRLVNDTLNPVFFECLKQQTQIFENFRDSPPISIKIFDKDKFSSDLMGRTIVDIQQGVSEKYIYFPGIRNYDIQDIKPKWIQLKLQGIQNAGQVLCSFLFMKDVMPMFQQIPIEADLKQCQIKLRLLGFRNLKSSGILPVNRPFLVFNLSSIQNNRAPILNMNQKISTQPNNHGPNANICCVLNFDAYLPVQKDLCPFLSVQVYDQHTLIPNILIGTFSIDLRYFYEKTEKSKGDKILKAGQAFLGVAKEQVINKPNFVIPQSKDSSFKIQLQENYQQLQEQESIDDIKIEDNFEQNDQVINEKGNILSKNIVFVPTYIFNNKSQIYREKDKHDKKKYLEIGYDMVEQKKINKSKKHYRYFIDKNLEDSQFMDTHTFDEFEIMNGKKVTQDGLFSVLDSTDPEYQNVGMVKGWVEVDGELNEEKRRSSTMAQLLPELFDKSQQINLSSEDIDKQFMIKQKLILRLYVIDAFNLAQLDSNSLSDPYLVIHLGKAVFNKKSSRKNNQTNASFNEYFEIPFDLPGHSNVKIEVWDYNDILPDELIGFTTIDLENRFYSQKWRNLLHKPIETRELKHSVSFGPRGSIRLWTEIFHANQMSKQIKWDIQSRPSELYELRIVIWDCDGIPAQDIEDVSDLYVTARIGDQLQSTDIHYRSQDGRGSFNWRMLFPLYLPMNDNSVTFQIWDKDLFGPNDFVAETQFDFTKFAEEAYENQRGCEINNNTKKSQENKLNLKLKLNATNSLKSNLNVSMELVPMNQAQQNKVGKGREEPNHSPYCSPPYGRFSMSMNPFTLFNQLVGPAVRQKICIYICIIMTFCIMISIFPTIIGGLIIRK